MSDMLASGKAVVISLTDSITLVVSATSPSPSGEDGDEDTAAGKEHF